MITSRADLLHGVPNPELHREELLAYLAGRISKLGLVAVTELAKVSPTPAFGDAIVQERASVPRAPQRGAGGPSRRAHRRG